MHHVRGHYVTAGQKTVYYKRCLRLNFYLSWKVINLSKSWVFPQAYTTVNVVLAEVFGSMMRRALTLYIPVRWLCWQRFYSWPLPDKWTQCYLSAGAFHHHTCPWTPLAPAGEQCSFVPLWGERHRLDPRMASD